MPAGSILELDASDSTTIALLESGAISEAIDPALDPTRSPNLTGFFWSLQSDPIYQSIVSAAYGVPALLAALDTARLLFLAPDVFEATIGWGLQQLADAIAATSADHSLDRDAIVTQINALATANDLAIALT